MEVQNVMTIAEGLRKLADWYDDHPEVGMPLVRIEIKNSYIAPQTAIEQLGILAKAFGKCEKRFNDWSYNVERRFGPVKVYGSLTRDAVCKRIVTWECPESLLAAIGSDAVKAFEEA